MTDPQSRGLLANTARTSPRLKPRPSILPFLKWAGGKRWLFKNYNDLFPPDFGRYIEPFLGSAAIFFALHPSSSSLSDCNEALIECYEAIRDDHGRIEALLEEHDAQHGPEYYYKVRSKRFRTPATNAAAFIYLNRVCWNGLYRVNRQGQFNVPIGTKTAVIMDTDDFGAISRRLRKARLRVLDFEAAIDLAQPNDFVFADPPYTVKHNNNGFVKYNEALFEWSDQQRLKAALQRASLRGVKFMLTNADHASVWDLYQGHQITKVHRSSVLSGNSLFRGGTSEIVVTNY